MIITRFAPSPTGTLHIGSVRTILFNWLFAKRFGGKFLLRIEDTDRERSKEEFVENIYQTMNWLGLHWDEEPVFQHKNLLRHAQIANELLYSGKAYKCYCTQEELEQSRAKAISNKQTPKYSRKCRELQFNLTKPYAIRLKASMTGKTEFVDLIQGHCSVNNEHMDDMILLRSDGTPTYMLAVVVDDHDMKITHVIRGSEHLNNAYRQKQIYEACGWNVPEFAHVSLIHAEDGAKLSKRHGATSADEYKKQGFLPEAILNYLLRLGFSGGVNEIISIEKAIKIFDIKEVRSSSARFSLAKLLNVNSIYIREKINNELLIMLQDFVGKKKYNENGWIRILLGMNELKARIRTLQELAVMSEFYGFEEDYFGHIGKNNFVEMFIHETEINSWNERNIENWFVELMQKYGKTLKEIAPDFRFALTKQKVAPSVFELMKVLGKDLVVKRLKNAIL